MPRLIGKPPIGVKRRGTSSASRGLCLPVRPIDNIARGEDPGYRSPRRRLLDEQVAIVIGGELTLEQAAARIMTDRHEHPRNSRNPPPPGLTLPQSDPGHPALPHLLASLHFPS